MSTQSRSTSTLVILRWAWCVLRALLILLVWIPAGAAWWLATGLLWLAGVWLLMRPGRSASLADTWYEAFGGIAPRMALVVLIAWVLLVAHVFSSFAAIVLATVAGLIGLAAAAAGAPELLREGVTGVAMLGVTLVLALGAGE